MIVSVLVSRVPSLLRWLVLHSADSAGYESAAIFQSHRANPSRLSWRTHHARAGNAVARRATAIAWYDGERLESEELSW